MDSFGDSLIGDYSHYQNIAQSEKRPDPVVDSVAHEFQSNSLIGEPVPVNKIDGRIGLESFC